MLFIKHNWYKLITSYLLAFCILFLYHEPGILMCSHEPSFLFCFASNLITSPLIIVALPIQIIWNGIGFVTTPIGFDERSAFLTSIGKNTTDLIFLVLLSGIIYALMSKLPTFFHKKSTHAKAK